MEKLNGESMDMLSKNIEIISKEFPEAIVDGKIDFEVLRTILGDDIEETQERFNFSWNGKRKSMRIAQTPSKGTLLPCKEESKDWDTTQNLYIEGDNLEVLKLLQKSYYGKIKMIYIDPPYNTGGDFVYKDDFADGVKNYKELTGQINSEGKSLSTNTESNGRFHTDWLNLMYPRLRLARNLLKEDGVMFISIDEHEMENLVKIMNEVFGEDNKVGIITIKSNPRGSMSTEHLASLHEYLVVYSKKYSTANIIGHPLSEEMEEEYKFSDDKGKYRMLGLRMRGGFWRRSERPNLYFPIYINPKDCTVSLEKDKHHTEEAVPVQPSTMEDGTWRWSKEKIRESTDLLLGKKVKRGNVDVWDVFQKDYLDRSGGRRTKTKSIWDEPEINYQNGTTEIKQLLGDSACFDYPKPTFLIKRAIEMVGVKDGDIIMDFFSGSATTAHAVMSVNTEKETMLRYVLVQLPEVLDEYSKAFKLGYCNLCDIGKSRISKAGEKIKAEIEEENSQLEIGKEPKQCPDIGFKVFKLDSSNIKEWQPDYDEFERTLTDSLNNFVEGRTEEDVVYEIMLKLGLDLTYPVEETVVNEKKMYSIGFGALMICLDDDITSDIADEMVRQYKDLQPETWKVVFKDIGFKDDSAKTNIKEILKSAGLEEDAFTTI